MISSITKTDVSAQYTSEDVERSDGSQVTHTFLFAPGRGGVVASSGPVPDLRRSLLGRGAKIGQPRSQDFSLEGGTGGKEP